MSKELMAKLSNSIADGDEVGALQFVQEALDAGMVPMTILDEGGTAGMDIVNKRYDDGDAYLPELVVAGDTMKQVVDVIFARIEADGGVTEKRGVVVIAQAEGDVHDIGKNVVTALLGVNGFEVHDLGIDVPFKKIINKAEEVGADIIAQSTLLTTSLPFLEDVVAYLRDTGKRDKYFYVVGGGPVTTDFAKRIGADGWGRNAFDAVELFKKLMTMDSAPEETIILDSEHQG
jgi:corrinoid protein of di/trimethylamine methyltransferase